MLSNQTETLIQKNDIVDVEELSLQENIHSNCCKISLD